jgi:type I restriction enzyme S subunit
MKENWELKKLGEISVINMGQSPKGSTYNTTGEGVPLINGPVEFGGDDPFSKTLKTKFTTEPIKMCKQGDLILCVRGSTTGRMNIAGFDSCIGRGVASISSTEHQEWINQYINFNRDVIYKLGNGSTFPNVSSASISNLLIPIPPKEQQQRIVSLLRETLATIAKAKENAEKNLQNSHELFESYLQSLFSSSYNEWDEKTLGDSNLIEIIDGDRGKNYPKKSDFLDTGFCLFLNTKNVRPDGFNFETRVFIDEKKDNELGSGKLKRNDVVMTTRGTIGNTGIYSHEVEYENIRINSGMLIFRPNLKAIIPEYLFEILRSGIIRAQIKKHVSGTAQPQLPIKTLVNFTFPVPKSLPEQQSIVAKLDALSDETKRLEEIYLKKLAALDELKKSVLHKAFNGELTGA